MNNLKNRVAIYCRLSSEDLTKINKNDDSESIQNQKMLLIDYAMKQGFDIAQIYSDDDYSGIDRNRPEWRKMLSDAKDRKFDIILCKSQSRFTRDMEIVERYIHGLFPVWGIRFISVIDNADTDQRGNKKSRQINALINEWYLEDLSDNIKAVLKRKMQDGQFIGSFASYGYAKDPNDRHKLVVDEEAAEVVREIFDLYIEGYGAYQICCKLTERKLPTPTAYKKKKGLKFVNPNSLKYSEEHGVWAHNTVKRILQDKIYIGYLIQGREKKASYKSEKRFIAPKDEWAVIPNNHEPIIDEKTFDTVQNLIANRRQVHKPKNGYKGGQNAHILAGKVVCMDCGHAMHRGGTARDGVTHYMRCRLAHKTKNQNCTPHTIKLKSLINIVESRIKELVNTYMENQNNMEAVWRAIGEQNDDKKLLERKQREHSACSVKIEDIKRSIAQSYMDKVKGVLTEEAFLSIKQIFDVDLESYQVDLIHLKTDIDIINGRLKSERNIRELLDQYISFESLTHEIVNDFIDKVEVGEKNEDGEQEVIINWLF